MVYLLLIGVTVVAIGSFLWNSNRSTPILRNLSTEAKTVIVAILIVLAIVLLFLIEYNPPA